MPKDKDLNSINISENIEMYYVFKPICCTVSLVKRH